MALFYCTTACWRLETGESSTKRVDMANSLFWDPSDTTTRGSSQGIFFTEESIQLRRGRGIGQLSGSQKDGDADSKLLGAPVASARVKTGISHKGEDREKYQGENWSLSQGVNLRRISGGELGFCTGVVLLEIPGCPANPGRTPDGRYLAWLDYVRGKFSFLIHLGNCTRSPFVLSEQVRLLATSLHRVPLRHVLM